MWPFQCGSIMLPNRVLFLVNLYSSHLEHILSLFFYVKRGISCMYLVENLLESPQIGGPFSTPCTPLSIMRYPL